MQTTIAAEAPRRHIESLHIYDDHGNGRIVAALLMPTLIVYTLALRADADCHELIGDIQPALEAGIARLATAPIGILDARRYVLETLANNIGEPSSAQKISALIITG